MNNSIGHLVTYPIFVLKSKLHAWRTRRFYRALPAREVFSRIYRSKAWGSHPERPFCSGDGSIREDVVGPYCDQVRGFIRTHNIKHVVDLGCGDFAVGQRLLAPGLRYTAIDIVSDLVEYNRKRFANMNVEFACLDIIDDELPKGDLCLVRQVLQHLSNAEIKRVLDKLRKYKFVIVTEHVYSGPGGRPNVDKPHGPNTRIPKRSGVFLDSPPFNCEAKVLIELPMSMHAALRAVVIDGNAIRASTKSDALPSAVLGT